jgi:phage terminase large subunit GpA-like protein
MYVVEYLYVLRLKFAETTLVSRTWCPPWNRDLMLVASQFASAMIYQVPSGKLTVGPWKSPIFRGN